VPAFPFSVVETLLEQELGNVRRDALILRSNRRLRQPQPRCTEPACAAAARWFSRFSARPGAPCSGSTGGECSMVAAVIQRHPRGARAPRCGCRIAQECALLLRELDFRLEAEHAARFPAAFPRRPRHPHSPG